MNKILLCDLDGTIRTTLSGETFAKHSRDYKAITGVYPLLSELINKGWRIYGISNQGGVAAGHKSLERCIAEMHYTMDILPHLTSILFCPDFEGTKCLEASRMNIYNIKNLQNVGRDFPDLVGNFRKPKSGMLEVVLCQENMRPPFDADELLMIGDRPEDRKAANAIEVPFMWAKDWNKTK